MNISVGVEKTLAQHWQQIHPAFPVNEITGIVHWRGDTVFASGTNWSLIRSIGRKRERLTLCACRYLPFACRSVFLSSLRQWRCDDEEDGGDEVE